MTAQPRNTTTIRGQAMQRRGPRIAAGLFRPAEPAGRHGARSSPRPGASPLREAASHPRQLPRAGPPGGGPPIRFPGAPRCGSFEVNTVDSTTGKSTQLPRTSSFGLTFNWAFAGALEVYNVSKCSDYPANSSTEFYYLGLFDEDLQPVTQGWVPWKRWAGFTPQCGYGISGGNKGGLPYIKLSY